MVYAYEPMILAQSSSDADEAVGEALHGLRLRDTHYCRTELTAPWGLQMEPCDMVMFHFVAAGRCWLSGAGEDRWLEPGDLVVFPRGQGHLLVDRPGSPARPVQQLPKLELGRRSSVLAHGGGGTRALLLCGGSQFDPPDQPLVGLLPQVMVLTNTTTTGDTIGDGRSQDWVGTILGVMGAEAAAPRAGGETIVTRLSDVVLVHAIRAWLATSPQAREGWLGALRDRHLGRALAAMHRDPGHPWTVASLAACAYLSRSAFAQRFTAAVGVPPSAYLTRVRMRLATAWMRDHGLTPSQVAPRVGYDSIAAFTRAYKRSTGRTPGSVRQPI